MLADQPRGHVRLYLQCADATMILPSITIVKSAQVRESVR